jgi:hypothetical protein
MGYQQPQYLMGPAMGQGYYQPEYGGVGQQLDILGAEAAAQVPPGRRAIVREEYTKERGLLLPFGRATVGAGLTADFTANPQVPFRPSSLIIGATAIAGLVVDDIKVGKNSQFVASGAAPAAAFGSDATFKGLKFDTAVPGIDIVITVTDVSAVDNVVSMAMFGVAAD